MKIKHVKEREKHRYFANENAYYYGGWLRIDFAAGEGRAKKLSKDKAREYLFQIHNESQEYSLNFLDSNGFRIWHPYDDEVMINGKWEELE